jgi:asparagine synthase (glutamine-hydrolysing)
MIVSHWTEPPVVRGSEPSWGLSSELVAPGLGEIERMMVREMATYLPDDVMAKVDRASMSVSLESRAPLLDHRVVEYALRLPLAFKLRGRVQKWALRQVLYRHLPKEIVDRPKMGFSVPIADWLRGPLRPWAEALLDPQRLMREGYLQAAPIRRKWTEHLSGRFDWRFHLWNVLMFQAWLEAERSA